MASKPDNPGVTLSVSFAALVRSQDEKNVLIAGSLEKIRGSVKKMLLML